MLGKVFVFLVMNRRGKNSLLIFIKVDIYVIDLEVESIGVKRSYSFFVVVFIDYFYWVFLGGIRIN